MLSFKTFATAGKNLHLEHLEDQIIDKGAEGGKQAVAFLKSIRQINQIFEFFQTLSIVL